MKNTEVERHLGRTALGVKTPAYVTPTEIDPNLLVAVPRADNRTDYGITPSDFIGFDRWNCYEFSTLLQSGYPLHGSVQILYPSSTDVIVESKSLKLFLNSFNLFRFPVSTPAELETACRERITDALQGIGIRTEVRVLFDIERAKGPSYRSLLNYQFPDLEERFIEDASRMTFQQTDRPERLLRRQRAESLGSQFRQRFQIPIRSNCKVTNQPDWGRVYVALKPRPMGTILAPRSFMEYVVSMRGMNHFHEEICEIIYKHISDFIQPAELLVACNYTRRGGIDINPLRASSHELLWDEVSDPAAWRIPPDLRQ